MTNPSRPERRDSCRSAARRATSSPRSNSCRRARQWASWSANHPASGSRSRALLEVRRGLAQTPLSDEQRPSHGRQRPGVLGGELEGPPEGVEALRGAAEAQEGAPHQAPGPGRGRPALEGPAEAGQGPVVELGEGQVVRLGGVGVSQLDEGPDVGGVEGHRALEEQDRPVQRLVALDLQVDQAPGEGLVGLHHERLLARRRRRRPHAQAGRQLADDPVLEGEDVVEASVDLHRAQNAVALDVGQAGGHPDGLSGSLEGAGEHPAAPSCAPDPLGEGLVDLPGLRAGLAQRLSHAGRRDDREPGQGAEVGHDGLREAGAEPAVLAVARDVGEPEDRHRQGELPCRSTRARHAAARRWSPGPRSSRPAAGPPPWRASAAPGPRPAAAGGPRRGRGGAPGSGGARRRGPARRWRRRRAARRRPTRREGHRASRRRPERRRAVPGPAPGPCRRACRGALPPPSGPRSRLHVAPSGAPEDVLLGQAEVQDLEPPARRHHDVGGLDVPVDDPPRVGLGEGLGEAVRDVQGPLQGRGPVPDVLSQRLAGDVLHRDEPDRPRRTRSLDLVDLVDDRDARVVERRRGPCLAEQPGPGVLVRLDVVPERLEGHRAVQAHVLGEVDLAHAAASEALEDAIVPDGLADQEWAIMAPAPAGAGPPLPFAQGEGHDGPGLLLDPLEVGPVAEALRVELVDVLGAGGPGGEPAVSRSRPSARRWGRRCRGPGSAWRTIRSPARVSVATMSGESFARAAFWSRVAGASIRS